MIYKLSEEIQKAIQLSTSILLNCHRSPDSDSVGSALSLREYLLSLGKKVTIVCPDKIPENLQFLVEGVDIAVSSFDDLDFSQFDLAIITDTNDWGRLYNNLNSLNKPNFSVIVVDNHETNHNFGNINLLDFDTSSVCEMIHNLFLDFGYNFSSLCSTYLLSGIVGDTGCFKYEVHKNTLNISQKLIEKGADIEKINLNLFFSYPLELVKFWSIVIDRLTVTDSKIAYSAIPYEIYKNYVHLKNTRETVASSIIQCIQGIKIGFILTEDQPSSISISFRSRLNYDVGKLANNLGGGGHKGASGVHIEGVDFNDYLKLVISESEKILNG